jgi:hypothetical protein
MATTATELYEEKYLPPMTERIGTLKSQIDESKKIIYRTSLQMKEVEALKNEVGVKAAEKNIENQQETIDQLINKIDVYEKELDALQV